jgi:RsiW-degrading membrane proteinase PrsW (M82 family)
MGMNDLHVTLGDRTYSFRPDETVRIGRSPDNDIVVSDPTVSRQHAQLSLGAGGWEFENVGRALSFLNGEPVTRALLSGDAQIQLSSVRGPVLTVTTASASAPSRSAGANAGGTAPSDYPGDSAWPEHRQDEFPQPDLPLPPIPSADAPRSGFAPDEPAPPSYSAADPPLPPIPAADPPQRSGFPPAEPALPSYSEGESPRSGFPPAEPPESAFPSAESPQSGFPPAQSEFQQADYPPPGIPRADSPPLDPRPADSPQPGFPFDERAPAEFPQAGSPQPGYPSSRFPAPEPPQPGYAGQPDYASQADYSGGPDYLGRPDSPGQPDYSGGPDYAGQSGYASQPEEPAESEDPDRPDRTSVLDKSAIADGAGYPYGPASPAGAAYPASADYPQDLANPAGSGNTERAGYGDGAAYPGASGPGEGAYPGEPGYPGAAVPRIRPVAGQQPVDEIATALHILVPIRSWLHDPGWRQFLRLLVIPYGLLPLIFIALFASSSNLATPGWAYSLYIAPLWAIAFWLLIRPGKVDRQDVAIGVGAIVFALIWVRLITVHINDLMGPPGKPLPFFGAIGVGINEEITKALPILLAALLLLKYRSVKLDVRMWMFLGTIVGLAFGVTEQAGYTLQDIQGITAAQANSQAIVEVLAFAERVFVDGFQHAMWAGVSAFFIGMAVNYPRRRLQLICFGIAVPAFLHGFYDWSAGAFASLWIPIIIQAISLFLFLGYTMSAEAIERQVRRTPMFRGESMLMERISDRTGPHRSTDSASQGVAPADGAFYQPGDPLGAGAPSASGPYYQPGDQSGPESPSPQGSYYQPGHSTSRDAPPAGGSYYPPADAPGQETPPVEGSYYPPTDPASKEDPLGGGPYYPDRPN